MYLRVAALTNPALPINGRGGGMTTVLSCGRREGAPSGQPTAGALATIAARRAGPREHGR